MDSNIIDSSKDTDYIKEFIRYIEIRAKAQKKGIDVLAEVNEPSNCHSALVTNDRKYNYAVVKYICGLDFAITEDGEVYLDYRHDGPYLCHDTIYCYSISEAERMVENYNENILQMPKFYGFIRQYEGEPHNILDYQVIALNYFAEKHSIKYEAIFGCKGGYAEPQEGGRCIEDTFNIPGIDNVHRSCEKFFSDIAENDGILCIADRSRLDGDYIAWHQDWDIIEVDSVPYNHDNIMAYQEYKPEQECVPENTPEQEYYIPEYGHNSIPGDIPECILKQEYDYAPDHMQEYGTGNIAPF